MLIHPPVYSATSETSGTWYSRPLLTGWEFHQGSLGVGGYDEFVVDLTDARSRFAIDNDNVNNLRYGVFIEQLDSFDKVYGNTTTTRDVPGIPGHGVESYNNATSRGTRAVTDKNTVFSNVSDIIANGLRNESIAFTPVAARFLRVRMEKLLGEPVGFEQIAVNPM